jgi:hypothetical protein
MKPIDRWWKIHSKMHRNLELSSTNGITGTCSNNREACIAATVEPNNNSALAIGQ